MKHKVRGPIFKRLHGLRLRCFSLPPSEELPLPRAPHPPGRGAEMPVVRGNAASEEDSVEPGFGDMFNLIFSTIIFYVFDFENQKYF